ncbi:hypothetical protein [Polluticoccus soli]|uniref:hypothetical protein n=1 Tax=Polluticoccus soli TaxID=3034150 RepID=UPI0023E2D361|nr:hypothetical protein [Flavipsychrobacter sp. JY13-12]
MKQQHEKFVEAMAEHGDPVKAYLAAYPNAKESSARSATYRLLQDPEIAQAVTFDAKRMHKKAKAAAIKKGTKRVTQQLADIQSRREVLAQMIFGTVKRKRFFKIDGEVIWVEDDIPSQSVLRAIELDCKLEAGFDWTGRRTTTEKKEKQEPAKPGPDNPIEPDLKDITGVVILIGDTLFEKKDAEWIERYTAWKNANPEKVKEWTVETKERSDHYIALDEDYGGLQKNWKHNGNHSLIMIMRFANGLPRGPFIPGQSRYFTSYDDQHAAYGTKPYNYHELKQKEKADSTPNSPLELSDSDLMSAANNSGGHFVEGKIPISPLEGGHFVEDKMGGCPHNAGQTTQENLQSNQQNATIQLPPNPPQSANILENRKLYHTSDELWEAYRAALPAWPHMAEKTKRSVEQMFRNSSMSQQRRLLWLKLGARDDKNSAA